MYAITVALLFSSMERELRYESVPKAPPKEPKNKAWSRTAGQLTELVSDIKPEVKTTTSITADVEVSACLSQANKTVLTNSILGPNNQNKVPTHRI